MKLRRFGNAAFDPETIARIEDGKEEPAGEDRPPVDSIRVVFMDGKTGTFYGQSAAAIRAYVASLFPGFSEGDSPFSG